MFECAVGWRYGLVFGVATVLTGWGYDGWEQLSAPVGLAGVKLLLAAIVIIPLTILAGALAARARDSVFRRLTIWFFFGGATGIAGLIASFAGVSIVAMMIDAAVRDIWIFPMTPGVTERLPIVALFGAGLGVLAGVFQPTAVNWAWDSASSDNRFTRAGWRSLLIALPVAITLGALYDGALNAQLRAPYQLTQRYVNVGLNLPANPDLSKMSNLQIVEYGAVASWRDHFSPQATHHLVDYNDATLNEAVVDVAFDNGFVWRCETTWSGSWLRLCRDLTQTYRDWMTQFLRAGVIDCADCSVVIDSAAMVWFAQSKNAIGEVKDVSMIHRTGGVVIAHASGANQVIDCRFIGANPTLIRDCVFK